MTNAILFDGIWYNPAFFPPPPTIPTLSLADAIAAARSHFQTTNTGTANAVSPPMVVDAAAAGGLTPLSPQGQIRVDANNRAVADFGPHKVSWAADIADEGGTVDMFTSAGEELKSYLAGVYYLSADGQSSALIASLQSSTAQIVPPAQVLYPDAFVSAIPGVSVSMSALYHYDINSLSQDLVIRKQLPPPSMFATSLANPNAPDLRLAVITVFPGITPQPTLVPTPVNLDDPRSGAAEPDTDILFSGARMIAGHAFLTGDNPTPIPVVKSWQYIDQNWCLVESVPLSLIQNALSQLPPATASLNAPNNGGTNPGSGAHGVTRPTPAASLAQNAKLGGSPALPGRPSSIVNGQSQMTSLHLPPPALRLGQSPPHQTIKFVQALPPGPALVWDYVIVNAHVMDFVFGPRVSSGGVQDTETGFAAAGASSTDVWNKCPTTDNNTYTGLVWSDNTSSSTSVTFGAAPGNWGNPVSDVMYSGYVYTSGGNFTVTISNLASGTYNFYIYGHGAANSQYGIYGLVSGSLNYGTNSTANDSYSWNSSVWEQGEEYVVCLEVAVSSNSPVVITVLDDPGGYSIVNGMQIVPSAYSCLPGPSGLISWWQADGNANDVLGANNATAYNMSYVSGVTNEGFDFNGSSSYVKASNSASLNVGVNGTGITLACWIKPAVLGWQPLFEWNSGTGSDPWGVLFWIYGNPQSLYADFIDINTNFNIISAPSYILTTNAFQHAAVTYDTNSGTSVIYWNGTAQVTANLGSFIPQTSYPLYLGFRPAGGPPAYYSGVMDDVSVFNRALSAVEIAALYKAGQSANSVCVPPVPPTITTPPASQTITAGNDSLPFTVAATGTPPLSYQWQTNGVNIPGATATSYTAWNVPIGTNSYTVIVSNPGGSTTSATATLAATNAIAVVDPLYLEGWYQAEGNALDSTGGHNGTTMGNTTFVPGKVGQAFYFNGTNAYVTVTDSAGLLDYAAHGMTIECWIKPSALSAQPLAEWNNTTNYGTSLWITNTQSLVFTFLPTNGTPIFIEAPANLLQTNTWQHVAATYDTNGNAIIYYNGQAVVTNFIGTGLVPQTGESHYSFYLGYRASTSNYYVGLMDEVSFYNRGLTASEILGIYNASTAGKFPWQPDISPEPFSSTIQCGSAVTLSVGVDAGTPPFSYQWQFNGSNLAGATNSALNLPFMEPDQFGNYDVVVTNPWGPTNSSTATLTEVGPPLSINGAVWLWGDNSFGESVTPGGLTNLAAVAAGYSHSLALQQNGTVLAWGSNSNGQTSVPAGLTNVVAIAAGENHSLALSQSMVVAWGSNSNCQTSVPAGLTNVIAIAAGGYQSMALRSNGTVVSWGATYATVPSALTNVTAIAAGFNFSLALSNGFVVAWGTNDSGQLNVPAGLNNVVAIAAGGAHALALKANGTVVAWGSNGDGESTVRSTLTNVMAIAAGFWHSLALSNNGTVVAWGANTNGQTNVPSGLTNVKSIAAGELSSLALEFSPLVQYYPLTAANDLLLIYNTNSTDSGTVLNYYLANRPLVANANVLGLGTANYPGISGGDYETVIPTDFTNQIATPLIDWLNSNPTKRPQYVVLFPNVPSRVSLWADSGSTNFPYYQTGSLVPSVSLLIHSLLPGWSPFVTYINMTNVADCENYISKLKTTGKLVSPGTLLLSASQAGYGSTNYGNTNYIIDNVRSAGYATNDNLLSVITNALLQNGVLTNAIVYLDGLETNLPLPHLTNESNVAGYISWGAHSFLGPLYATTNALANGSIPVNWTGQSSWYLIRTEESFNGQRYQSGQGDFLQWFAPTAFGGTGYANTPVAAISYTDEPSAAGTLNDVLFKLWAGGNNFGICAWNSLNTTNFQAVGDPFVVH